MSTCMHTICTHTFTHMPTYMHNTQRHENGKRLKEEEEEEEEMMMMKTMAVAMAEKRWPDVHVCVGWGGESAGEKSVGPGLR